MKKRSVGISRRTVLRGLGATLALPWLEAMDRAAAAAGPSGGSAVPRRVAFLYVPNGMHMADWMPAVAGPLAELPPILKPLSAPTVIFPWLVTLVVVVTIAPFRTEKIRSSRS